MADHRARLAATAIAVLTAIGLLSITAPAPADVGNTNDDVAAPAAVDWSPCVSTSAEYKLIRRPAYYIAGATVPQSGRGAELYCGNSEWGERHITIRHQGDWTTLAKRVRKTWKAFADHIIEHTLRNPAQDYELDNKVKYRANFHTRVGSTVKHYCSMVVMKAASGRIITAFFGRGYCP